MRCKRSSGTARLPAATSPWPVSYAARPGVTTDLVKATLDSQGGSLVRLELLTQKETVEKPWYSGFTDLFGSKASAAQERNMVLFDRSPQHVYLGQSGLLGAPGIPNHLTAM